MLVEVVYIDARTHTHLTVCMWLLAIAVFRAHISLFSIFELLLTAAEFGDRNSKK